MPETNFRALCAELLADYEQNRFRVELAAEARATLAQPEPAPPTDEELIEPIVWMIDDCIYDNDKGKIAESLRELIARWGTPANNTSEENFNG